MTDASEQCGALFVVGGAEDRSGARLILRQFAEAAGGPDARILVIATSLPHTPARRVHRQSGSIMEAPTH